MGVQARLNLYRNYNYIGVRSFILTGAPSSCVNSTNEHAVRPLVPTAFA